MKYFQPRVQIAHWYKFFYIFSNPTIRFTSLGIAHIIPLIIWFDNMLYFISVQQRLNSLHVVIMKMRHDEVIDWNLPISCLRCRSRRKYFIEFFRYLFRININENDFTIFGDRDPSISLPDIESLRFKNAIIERFTIKSHQLSSSMSLRRSIASLYASCSRSVSSSSYCIAMTSPSSSNSGLN